MSHNVIMPALGMNQETGVIAAWHKKDGDRVTVGEVIMDIETDKTIIAIEAEHSGFLTNVSFKEGEDVPVGESVACITDSNSPLKKELTHQKQSMQSSKKTHPAEKLEPVLTATVKKTRQPFVSPKARMLAKEQGIELSAVIEHSQSAVIQSREVKDYQAITSKRQHNTALVHQQPFFTLCVNVNRQNFDECCAFLLHKNGAVQKNSGHLLAALISPLLVEFSLIDEPHHISIKVDAWMGNEMKTSYLADCQSERFSTQEILSKPPTEPAIHLISFLGSHIIKYSMPQVLGPTIILSEQGEKLDLNLKGFSNNKISSVLSFSERLASAVESPMLHII